jgi:hypothetical protein
MRLEVIVRNARAEDSIARTRAEGEGSLVIDSRGLTVDVDIRRM